MGYEAPLNTQFSVFLDNRVGKLIELLDVFEGQATQLAALSVVESTGHAVVRVLTSRATLARRLLNRHELPFAEAEVLVVQLDHAQTLSCACHCLLSAEVGLQYAYPAMCLSRGKPAMVICTEDNVLAGQILRRKVFTLLAENDLGDNATPGGNLDLSSN